MISDKYILVIFKFIDFSFLFIFGSITLLYIIAFFYYKLAPLPIEQKEINLFNKKLLSYYLFSVVWIIVRSIYL